MVEAPLHHINLDQQGTAYVAGTSIKVAAIAVDALIWGMTPQEIRENYPKLSLAQIHAALAYYYDHQTDIEAQLASWDTEYDQLRAGQANPLTREQWEERRRAQVSGELAP